MRSVSGVPTPATLGLPVVGETWDGMLNDLNGFHVRPEHVYEAIAAAGEGPVREGSVGSGTGMISPTDSPRGSGADREARPGQA